VRFMLDNDVDARVRRVITARGHECFTAVDVNLSDAADDELTVYADTKRAVLVTHDKEFSRRRSKRVVGMHVHLRCREEDAVEVLDTWFDDMMTRLRIAENIFVRVSRTGVSHTTGWS
jgi:predicted nuclease of predicted toxin-antitoxin system